MCWEKDCLNINLFVLRQNWANHCSTLFCSFVVQWSISLSWSLRCDYDISNVLLHYSNNIIFIMAFDLLFNLFPRCTLTCWDVCAYNLHIEYYVLGTRYFQKEALGLIFFFFCLDRERNLLTTGTFNHLLSWYQMNLQYLLLTWKALSLFFY